MNYRELFDSKMSSIKSDSSKVIQPIEDYLKVLDVDKCSLTDLFKHKNSLSKYFATLTRLTIEYKVEDLKDLITKRQEVEFLKFETEQNKTAEGYMTQIQSVYAEKIKEIQDKNAEIRSHNARVKAEIDEYNSIFSKVEVKRKRLLGYAKEIIDMCYTYGINITDINISNDMFTIEELSVLYDEFYDYLYVNDGTKMNPITKFRDLCNNNVLVVFPILALVVFLMSTALFDFLAILIIMYLFYRQHVEDSYVKRITVLAGLAFNVDPMSFGMVREIDEDELLSELSEELDIETVPEVIEIMDQLNEAVTEEQDEEFKEEQGREFSKFLNDYKNLEKEYEGIKNGIMEWKGDVIEKIRECIKKVDDKIKEIKSKIKPFGKDFSESTILSTEVKLGQDPNTMVYETKDYGFKNLIINPDINNSIDIDKFIKIMLINYMCNVRPGFLDITVYDPNGLGRSMLGFYKPELENLFSCYTDKLDDILKNLREHTNSIASKTRGKTVLEYNTESLKSGRMPIEYKVVIIISQPKAAEENEAVASLLEYSTDFGVFIWMVSSSKFKNTTDVGKLFDGIKNPIQIDVVEKPIEFMEDFYVAFDSLKSPSLSWEEFRNTIVPEEKVWSFTSDYLVELDPGFQDGDKSKFKSYTVGNVGDVHSICVGGTGAGKSVFINNLIANVCLKYSPKEINLWLIDFKGSEFAFYLKRPDLDRPYMLPHISACLCTSDPDYSVSLFEAIKGVSNKKYKDLIAKGYGDMYDYNTAMRKAGTPELCMKRDIVIVDEFQVIFEKTDNKSQAILKEAITQLAKVARAAGVHLFFCSQSMKGTMSDDILSQFTLRFGLRCDMAVSQAVMGTHYSGNIREKNGWLYVGSVDDKKKELQKLYRTPFIPKSQIKENIAYLYKRAEEEGIVRDTPPITYDEADIHSIDELDELYSTIPEEKTAGLFILGERMVYSSKGRRSNIILQRRNNEHIISLFSDVEDAVNFFKTIRRNLELRHDNYKCIYNSAEEDLGYLCHIDEIVDDTNRLFYEDEELDTRKFLDLMTQIVDMRKNVEDKSKLEPLYVFLLAWNKKLLFGVDNNATVTQKYNSLLQICGNLNVHFIFILTGIGEIPRSLPKSCNHVICGRTEEKDSNTLLNSPVASKVFPQKNGYMFYSRLGEVERLKIYRSTSTRKVEESELSI